LIPNLLGELHLPTEMTDMWVPLFCISLQPKELIEWINFRAGVTWNILMIGPPDFMDGQTHFDILKVCVFWSEIPILIVYSALSLFLCSSSLLNSRSYTAPGHCSNFGWWVDFAEWQIAVLRYSRS
jgi:hypothetical protein